MMADKEIAINCGRCLCWHANSQLLDSILQFILSERGIVPCPVWDIVEQVESGKSSNASDECMEPAPPPTPSLPITDPDDCPMMSDSGDEEFEDQTSSHRRVHLGGGQFPAPVRRRIDKGRGNSGAANQDGSSLLIRKKPHSKEKDLEKQRHNFVSGFRELQTAVREAFRSHNQGRIRQVIVCLGATPHTYKEQYRIFWPYRCGSVAKGLCLCVDGKPVSERVCSHVFRILFVKLSNMDRSAFVGSDRRVFVWALAEPSAVLPGFVDDRRFQLPSTEAAEFRKLKTIDLSVNHQKHCQPLLGSVEGLNLSELERWEGGCIWFKFDGFIQGFK